MDIFDGVRHFYINAQLNKNFLRLSIPLILSLFYLLVLSLPRIDGKIQLKLTFSELVHRLEGSCRITMLLHKSFFPFLLEFGRKVRITNKKVPSRFSRINFARERSRVANFNMIIASQDMYFRSNFYDTPFIKLANKKAVTSDFFHAIQRDN